VETGIDKKIQYRHKVTHLNWSSDQALWQITINAADTTKHLHARFIILASGYFDYRNPMKTIIPRIENFKGKVVHPQFWPEDFDYADKNIVIIGSGATAVTLLPALAETAKKVTMLQRSPGYIVAIPSRDNFAAWAYRNLPIWLSAFLIRLKHIIRPQMFFLYCQFSPEAAKKAIRKETEKKLKPTGIPCDPHFIPDYNPWDQRLCISPSGDFFKALVKGNADIVTDTIKAVGEKTIETSDGTILEPDVIITATGLKLQYNGGCDITVDNQPFEVSEKYAWKSAMIEDLPNLALMIGYGSQSWTLGADVTVFNVINLLKYMRKKGYSAAIPTLGKEERVHMKDKGLLCLESTYVKAAARDLPKAGNMGPWKPRDSYMGYLWDIFKAMFVGVGRGIRFEKKGI